MAKRRASGEGSIRKRKDGRYTAGHNPKTGKAIVKNVLAKTQAEVRDKLKRAHQIKRPPTGGLFICTNRIKLLHGQNNPLPSGGEGTAW